MQAPNQKGKHCIQGFVSLTTNTNRSFVVYEKSHLLHEDYFNGINHSKRWNLIDKKYMNTIKNTRKVLDVKAGDLVLWDSRTFHENQYGDSPEERLVQYVCYLPKVNPKNTASQTEKRKHYFYNSRTTTHWPYPIEVNGLQPQVYGDKTKLIDYSKLQSPNLDPYEQQINELL